MRRKTLCQRLALHLTITNFYFARHNIVLQYCTEEYTVWCRIFVKVPELLYSRTSRFTAQVASKCTQWDRCSERAATIRVAETQQVNTRKYTLNSMRWNCHFTNAWVGYDAYYRPLLSIIHLNARPTPWSVERKLASLCATFGITIMMLIC